MTSDRKLNETIGAWLEETAPGALPEHVLTATFERTRQSRQQLGWRGVLRRLQRRRFNPALGGAFVVAVAAVLALTVVPMLSPSGVLTPSPSATTQPTTTMWPQTSLEEVRLAQKLADAGNPAYTWQLGIDGVQLGQHHPCSGASAGCWRTQASAEIFRRFLVEKLGWQDFFWVEAFAHRGELVAGDVLFVRCAPGGTNPLYRGEPETSCGPTIDELRYETVKITVSQPDRQGSGGLWVVTDWEIVEPAVQVAPPSQAEIAAFLEPFFQARIAGAGAEAFVEVDDDPFAGERLDPGVPLLHASTTGSPFVRAEFEVVQGPVWPTARTELKVRSFTKADATVVEQDFSLEFDGFGAMRLVFAFERFEPSPPGTGIIPTTTENGSFVPVKYGFLDGAVTYRAAHPVTPDVDGSRAPDRLMISGLFPDEGAPRPILVVLADPRPIGSGCLVGAAPADAATLAASIGAFADFEATTPVAVMIGGRPGLQMDVVRPPTCGRLLENAPPGGPFVWSQARLYLVDLPGESARVLALIVVAADDDSFETVLSWATPVIESIEFHAP